MNNKEKYNCYPKNKFSDICIKNTDGKYKSKDACINDCEHKYIDNELIKINIKHETQPFYLFIKDIIVNEKIDVYLKGGNVLGLKILKMIYEKYKNDDIKFKKVFDKFLELDLVKDWDFSAFTKNNKVITPEYRKHLDKVASKYKLVPRASTFILYQTRKPILLEEKPLFEISVVDSDNYSKLELPLTTMKIKFNQYNLKYVFMFCKSFLAYKQKSEQFDFNIIKRMLNKINILVYPSRNGLYNVNINDKDFDKGKLNDDIIKFIKTFAEYDKNLPQFLATHIEDPFRILYRLIEKNIKKNDNIKEFLKDELNKSDINNQNWLFDSEFIKTSIRLFCKKLGEELRKQYINNGIEGVEAFLEGVSFNRIEGDYNMLTDEGIELLKSIFGKLINEITKDKINKLKSESRLIKFIKFFSSK
jgi:hypothetical protein